MSYCFDDINTSEHRKRIKTMRKRRKWRRKEKQTNIYQYVHSYFATHFHLNGKYIYCWICFNFSGEPLFPLPNTETFNSNLIKIILTGAYSYHSDWFCSLEFNLHQISICQNIGFLLLSWQIQIQILTMELKLTFNAICELGACLKYAFLIFETLHFRVGFALPV